MHEVAELLPTPDAIRYTRGLRRGVGIFTVYRIDWHVSAGDRDYSGRAYGSTPSWARFKAARRILRLTGISDVSAEHPPARGGHRVVPGLPRRDR